jgi:hypothetical protein
MEHPLVLIEILSPSNVSKTRANVRAYRTMPGVAEIVVLHTTMIAAEVLRRADGPRRTGLATVMARMRCVPTRSASPRRCARRLSHTSLVANPPPAERPCHAAAQPDAVSNEGASSLPTSSAEGDTTMHDTVIRGGTIIDAHRGKAFTGDVAIDGDASRRSAASRPREARHPADRLVTPDGSDACALRWTTWDRSWRRRLGMASRPSCSVTAASASHPVRRGIMRR